MNPCDNIQHWPRLKLLPSLLNPRRSFPVDELNRLALSMREKGVQQPLLSRILPRKAIAQKGEGKGAAWEVVCPALHRAVARGLTKESAAEIVAGLAAGEILEVCDGERRWRASDQRPHPNGVGILTPLEPLPVLVRELSDAEVLEMMLTSAIQREDLNELEECDGFHRLLAEKDADGNPVHSIDTMRLKIGVTVEYVRQRLALQKLSAEGRAAMEQGKINFSQARVICGAPCAMAALLLDIALNPHKFPIYRAEDFDASVTAENLREVLLSLSRFLDRAPFDKTDETLLPVKTDETTHERLEGGPCATCPFNSSASSSNGSEAPDTKRERGRPPGEVARCLNPGCYDRKVEIHVAKEQFALEKAGATILKGADAKEALKGGPAGTRSFEFVDLDRKLDPDERAKSIPDRKAPTWAKVVTDDDGKLAVPVFAALTDDGKFVRLAERKVAEEAARKLKKESVLNLSNGRARSVQVEDANAAEKKRKEGEKAKQKLRVEAQTALMAAIVEQTGPKFDRRGDLKADFWKAVLPIALNRAGSNGTRYVRERRNIPIAQTFETYADKLGESEIRALCIELLLSADFCFHATPNCPSIAPDYVKPLVNLLGLSIADV